MGRSKKHETLKLGRGRQPKFEVRKKPEGSGVVAGPPIRNGWGVGGVSEGPTGIKRAPS